MVVDSLLDVQESYLPMWMRAVRCIACSNIEDPLIQKHRRVQRAKAVKGRVVQLPKTIETVPLPPRSVQVA